MRKENVFKNCIPEADINEYFLYIYPDTPPKCTAGFVGYIGNHSNPNIKIKLEIDTPWMIEHNYRTCCLYMDDENKYSESCIIVMTALFFDLIRNNEYMQSALWHEVGHFHLNHYFNIRMDGSSSNKQREEYFEKGQILPVEKAADMFALYYMPKEDVIKEFNWMIKTRRENMLEPEKTRLPAVRELCMRKKFIKEFIDTEENMQKELCNLCGKTDFENL